MLCYVLYRPWPEVYYIDPSLRKILTANSIDILRRKHRGVRNAVLQKMHIAHLVRWTL